MYPRSSEVGAAEMLAVSAAYAAEARHRIEITSVRTSCRNTNEATKLHENFGIAYHGFTRTVFAADERGSKP